MPPFGHVICHMAQKRQASLFEFWSKFPVSNDDELQEIPDDQTPDSISAEGQSLSPSSNFLDDSTKPTTEGEDRTNSLQHVGAHNLLNVVICKVRELDKNQMYRLLTKPQDDLGSDLDVRYYPIDGGRKRKQVRFQNRWLQQYSWLRYGNSEGYVGGWCVCLLFLVESEKIPLVHSLTHLSSTTINPKKFVKNIPSLGTIYLQMIRHIVLKAHTAILNEGLTA